MDTILNVEHLTKEFKKKDGTIHRAVDDISFELKEGEIFSFLGPNGAGKSTSINMMTTQMLPTSGKIEINGTDISKYPSEVKKYIGIVAQHNNLDRNLTVKENLIFHGRYFGMEKQDILSRIKELLTVFGLDQWENEYVMKLSGGMMQRLKIARAMMHRPKLLFLDEPTTGLDPYYRQQLWDQMLKLNREEKTTIFLTTHYMEEVERFSDRIAIYHQGKIKAIGSLEELRELLPTKEAIYVSMDLTEDQKEKLQSLDEIQSIYPKDEKTWMIYPKTGSEALYQCIQFAHQNDIDLSSIQLNQTSLEDIFIYLTRKQEGEKL